MKTKRILLSLLTLLVSIGTSAYTTEIDGIYYNISGTKATVWYKTASGNSYSGNVAIPPTITSNGSTCNVTSIGDKAFYRCPGLTSIEIPNSVTSIDKYAFYECTGLTSVTIPNRVTSIGERAFYGCSGLTSFEIPNSVTSIGVYAFYDCTGLTSVTIGNSVTSIGDCAFQGCSGLTSIDIPNSVTTLGYQAFVDCDGITSLTIPENVTSSGRSIISDNLKELHIKKYINLSAQDNLIFGSVNKYFRSIYLYDESPTKAMRILSDYQGSFTATPKYDVGPGILYVPYSEDHSILAKYKELYSGYNYIAEMNAFELNVTEAGIASFYTKDPILIPDGTLAEENENIMAMFYAKGISGKTLILKRLKGVVPANTAVIVLANPGTYSLASLETTNVVEDNLMQGVLTATPIASLKAEGGYDVILTLGMGKTGGFIGFYNYTGSTLGAHKCYIGMKKGSGVKELSLQFDGEGPITNVEGMKVVVEEDSDAPFYDLSGRRVNRPVKGHIYITNGKKVLYNK